MDTSFQARIASIIDKEESIVNINIMKNLETNFDS